MGDTIPTSDRPGSPGLAWIHPKGRLTPVQWAVVSALLLAPILIAIVSELLIFLGHHPAARMVMLETMPNHLTHRFAYVLFIPIAALIVIVFRQTLGLRLLGPFRAILLAIALQVAGIGVGLLFFVLIVATVAALRPVLKSMRLGYYGRTMVLLSATSAAIAAVLVVASYLHWSAVERVAYFPIVVLMLSGDAFIRSVKCEGTPHALWRAAHTMLAAVVIALISSVGWIDTILVRYPELMISPLAAVIVVCELFDLRLLEGLAPVSLAPVSKRKKSAASKATTQNLQQPAAPVVAMTHASPAVGTATSMAPKESTEEHVHKHITGAAAVPTAMKVAVVRNRSNEGIITPFGRTAPERYGSKSVQRILDAIRAGGFQARVFEGDMSLLPLLKEYMPPDQDTGRPSGMVFNLAYGVQGDCRYTHVPAMLEMSGVPYTGANPLGHAVALDKVITKVLMLEAHIPTPKFQVVRDPSEEVVGLRFPVVVKPRHESSSFGLRLVYTTTELAAAVKELVDKYQQDALVEEYIPGREVAIGVLGNAPGVCLPLVEFDFGTRQSRLIAYDDKFHKTADEPLKTCPANLNPQLAERIRDLSLRAFRACHCLDYARVDIRIDETDTPYVLEVNSMASLGWGGSFVLAARQAGYSFSELICGIVDAAHERYFGTPAPRADKPDMFVPFVDKLELATAG